MVNIYETEGGKLNALQDFEEGCWVKVTAATMWEMEPVAKKYNIDIEDMRAALDEEEKSRIVLEEIIVRQLRKYKTRIANQQNSRKNFQPAYLEMETDGDEEVKIVRTKKFAIKPLDPEEACVEMELLGHSFFVFRNAQTNEVNVVYKRKGNTYGLIEPEN